jgi:hypothetical protein
MRMKSRPCTTIWVAMAAGLIAAALGVAVLCGWAFGIVCLQEIFVHAKKMAAGTALCFVAGR